MWKKYTQNQIALWVKTVNVYRKFVHYKPHNDKMTYTQYSTLDRIGEIESGVCDTVNDFTIPPELRCLKAHFTPKWHICHYLLTLMAFPNPKAGSFSVKHKRRLFLVSCFLYCIWYKSVDPQETQLIFVPAYELSWCKTPRVIMLPEVSGCVVNRIVCACVCWIQMRGMIICVV